jgi:hypothetical protein
LERTESNGQDRLISLVDVLAVLVRRWKLVVTVPILIVLCYAGIGFAGRRSAVGAPRVTVRAELVSNEALAPFLAMGGASVPAAFLGAFRNPTVLREALAEAGVQEIAGVRLDSFPGPAALDSFIATRLIRNQSPTGAPLPDTSRVYGADFRAGDQVFTFFLSDLMRVEQGIAFSGALIRTVNAELGAQVRESAGFYAEAVRAALRELPRPEAPGPRASGDLAPEAQPGLREFAVASRFLREPVDVLKPITPSTILSVPTVPWRLRLRNVILLLVVGLFVSTLLAFAWEYVARVRADSHAMATLKAAAAAAAGTGKRMRRDAPRKSGGKKTRI